MRTPLLALALFVAAPAFAATSTGSADAMAPAVGVDAAAFLETAAQPAVRVVIKTPMILSASMQIQTADGQLVRSYKDRLLWSGKSVVKLNVDDIPAGKYYLIVKTSLGSQTHTIVVE